MAELKNGAKKDVRLQVFVTEEMDDRLTDLADLMGMRKNELVRYAIGNLVMGYNLGVQEMKTRLDEELKNSPSV